LEQFLAGKNAAALESLREAGESLITLHKLNVPATLHVNLLSTNAIENPFLNVRRKIRRVTRWRAETDQASRWLAYGLLEAERGFRQFGSRRSTNFNNGRDIPDKRLPHQRTLQLVRVVTTLDQDGWFDQLDQTLGGGCFDPAQPGGGLTPAQLNLEVARASCSFPASGKNLALSVP
jgi:hypothetical protein